MNREQYKAHVKVLADTAISKTLERWHRGQDPAPEFLMKIEAHEISVHEIIKADTWSGLPSSWSVIFEQTYHQLIAQELSGSSRQRIKYLPVLAYCALFQDVIRDVEHKLNWLKEQGADLQNFLPTTVL